MDNNPIEPKSDILTIQDILIYGTIVGLAVPFIGMKYIFLIAIICTIISIFKGKMTVDILTIIITIFLYITSLGLGSIVEIFINFVIRYIFSINK